MMRASKDCIELIKRSEGFKSYPYIDCVGIPTIGYGSTRYEDGTRVKLGDQPIDTLRAEKLLYATLASEYEPGVNHAVQVCLRQCQFDALVDFAYNLGVNQLKASTLMRKLNTGDYEGAAQEFGKWVHGDGKVLPGLVTRREAERKLFLGIVDDHLG